MSEIDQGVIKVLAAMIALIVLIGGIYIGVTTAQQNERDVNKMTRQVDRLH